MLIENGLADAVNFLHLVLLTTMATGLYPLVARKLRGFVLTQ